MSEKKYKTIGEGGAHKHGISVPEGTNVDGMHKHLFFAFDRLLMTELDGRHSHPIKIKSNKTGPEGRNHEHAVMLHTQQGIQSFKSKNVTPHVHELQSGHTTLSGLHTHQLVLADQSYLSLLPGDLLEEIAAAAKGVPALKNLKLESDEPLETNFRMVKRLNKPAFKKVLKWACAKTIMKSLSRLKDGYQVESLILSRDRFSDIGVARRFIIDLGMNPQSSLEGTDSQSPFTFQIRSRERFDQSSMNRILVTDGVIAVVGLMVEGEVGQQMDQDQSSSEQPEVAEAPASDSLTENASEPPAKPDVVEGTIDEMSDSLKDKFDRVRGLCKSEDGETVKFVDWKTGKQVSGTAQAKLTEVAEAYGIDRKYVTIEYPERRFVAHLTSNAKYEIVSAAYADLGEKEIDEESDTLEYSSLVIKGENVDAFIITDDLRKYGKSLVIFFDDPADLDDIFKTEAKNYKFGAYQVKLTMQGPILIKVENKNAVKPILDEEILANLKRDTDLFFSKESEDFFNGKNDIGEKMPYKRGILMYGPPGNGKTTFIKSYLKTFTDGYGILCEAQDFFAWQVSETDAWTQSQENHHL